MKVMMKTMLMALVVAFTSCKSEDNSQALLKSHEWQLKSMTADGQAVANPEQLPVLAFDDSTRVAGSAGCNRFFGTYTVGEKGAITLVPGGSTMMYCPDMQFETEYLKALAQIAKFAVSAEKLTLKDAEGRLELLYVPAPTTAAE